MTAMQGRHQAVTPSPLSQSTSAVHLHTAQPEIHIPRKLSKRHTPTVGSIFPSQPDGTERKATSAPATPVDRTYIPPSQDAGPSNSTSLPKRMSVAPPPVQPLTSKKEKRGSMLNRLAKKFSILRKPTEAAGSGSEWWHIDSPESRKHLNGQTNFEKGRSSSPEKPHLGSMKRVPPPPIEPQAEPPPMESSQKANRISSSSLETPYSMGRLTIANPDLPDSDKEAPVTSKAPLPPEKHKDLPSSPLDSQILEHLPIETLLQPPAVPVSPTEVRSRLDKPLPPPQIPTPQFSQLGLPDLNTPTTSEQSLPPLPSQQSSPERSNAHSPPPQHIIPEPPKRVPSQLRTTLTSPQNSSVATDAVLGERSRTESPPIDPPLVQETPKRSPSQLKPTAGLGKDSPASPDKVTADPPTRTEHPPVQTQAHHETPKKPQSHAQESSSPNVITSPDTTSTRKNTREHPSSGRTPSLHQSGKVRERLAEGSSSKRYSTRKTGSQSRTESIPAPVLVPFPTTQQEIPNHQLASYEAYETSPLSTSSMIANPPTPYDHRLSLAVSSDRTPPTLPPKSIYEGKTSHNVTRTDPSPSRQTETFKLVRSSSGNVYASSQTITAAGQQWEVVESLEAKGYKEKSSSRTKDQEHRPRDHEHKPRARDQEQKSKESEHRAKDSEYRSKDYDHRSRDYDRSSRDYERRSKGYDRRTKEYEPRYDSRFKEYESRSKEYEPKSQDREPRKNYEHRDYEQRHKERDYSYRSKESERRSKDYDHKSKESERRSKDYDYKSKDYEHDSRRESKSKPNVDNTDHHKSSHRSSKQPVQQEESTKGRSSGKGGSRHHEERPRHEETKKSSRQRDEYRERRSERQATDTRSSSHQHSTQSSQSYPVPVQPPNPPPATVRLERNPSLTASARPTSELPSAADMNAMRAKESWDMERLWKARSMYGLEPNAPTTNFIPGPGSTSSTSDDAPIQGAVHGSSHTAYMVQTPFQSGRGTQIYHSMPTGPPPIIYSSPASIPSIPDSISSYEPYEHAYRPYPSTTVDYRSPPSMPRPPLNNPLPEPPRESPYDPATLTSTRGGKKQSNDYWTKYNGITTAH